MAIVHLLKALSNFVENVENPKYSILSLAQAEEYLEAEEENIDLDEELVEDVEDVEDDIVETVEDEFEQVDQTEKAVDELDEAIEMFEPASSSASKPTTQPSGQNSSVMENLEKVFSENPKLAPRGYKDEFPSDDEEDLSDLSESELKIATEAYNYFMKNAKNETELELDEDISDDEALSDEDSVGGDEDTFLTKTDEDVEDVLEAIQTAEIQDLSIDENDNSEDEYLPDFDAEDLDYEQIPTLIEPDLSSDEDIDTLLEELKNDEPTEDEEALDLDTFEDE